MKHNRSSSCSIGGVIGGGSESNASQAMPLKKQQPQEQMHNAKNCGQNCNKNDGNYLSATAAVPRSNGFHQPERRDSKDSNKRSGTTNGVQPGTLQ